MKDTRAASLSLSPGLIRGGVWEGVLTQSGETDRPPQIDIYHLGDKVGQVSISPSGDTTWLAQATIPTDALSDGVQTFALIDSHTGMLLQSFSVALGEALDADLRAEIDLLRAELDLLKRAFRRQFSKD
ncbi:MAG: hypothetical protein AAGO57_06380 [Pseudomonadota bacterium]